MESITLIVVLAMVYVILGGFCGYFLGRLHELKVWASKSDRLYEEIHRLRKMNNDLRLDGDEWKLT